jgi:dolichyl-phosphate beta-glucosyltransferase
MQKICIIFPCYNEEKRIVKSDFTNYLEDDLYTFIFVNDGSNDNTMLILREIQSFNEKQVIILDLTKNQGKSEAVRQGLLYANKLNKFDVIGFLDVDLATPISEVSNITEVIKDNIVVAFGSRIKKTGSIISRKTHRHIIGRIFATVCHMLFKTEAYDTQCGAKFFSSSTINYIFEKPFISKWIFDIEIFIRLRKFHNKHNTMAIEIPLNKWEDISGSKLKISSTFEILYDIYKIYTKY